MSSKIAKKSSMSWILNFATWEVDNLKINFFNMLWILLVCCEPVESEKNIVTNRIKKFNLNLMKFGMKPTHNT